MFKKSIRAFMLVLFIVKVWICKITNFFWNGKKYFFVQNKKKLYFCIQI